jgi:hypothetical protein
MRNAEKTKRKSEPKGFARLTQEKANTRLSGLSTTGTVQECTNSVAAKPDAGPEDGPFRPGG